MSHFGRAKSNSCIRRDQNATQLSTAVVIWVDLNDKIRLGQSHNGTRERLGVRRRI